MNRGSGNRRNLLSFMIGVGTTMGIVYCVNNGIQGWNAITTISGWIWKFTQTMIVVNAIADTIILISVTCFGVVMLVCFCKFYVEANRNYSKINRH